jgi:hypothetical protein
LRHFRRLLPPSAPVSPVRSVHPTSHRSRFAHHLQLPAEITSFLRNHNREIPRPFTPSRLPSSSSSGGSSQQQEINSLRSRFVVVVGPQPAAAAAAGTQLPTERSCPSILTELESFNPRRAQELSSETFGATPIPPPMRSPPLASRRRCPGEHQSLRAERGTAWQSWTGSTFPPSCESSARPTAISWSATQAYRQLW